jgi:uncharacterized protein
VNFRFSFPARLSGDKSIMPAKKILHLARPLILIAVVSYLGIASFLAIFQSGFIYFPERRIDATPNSLGLSYEEIVLRTEDGVRISAWYVPASGNRGTVLFCHGNGGNISHRLDSISIFNRLGLNVLIFDYRGYGMSEGSPDEQGTYRDAETAYRYLVNDKKCDPRRIIVFGRSLGGAVAAWLAERHAAGMLILESAFASIPDIAADLYPWLPVRLLTLYQYRTVDYVKGVRCPILVIHSPDDEMIPLSHGLQIYAAAGEPKSFMEISGGHNDGFLKTGKSYEEGLDAFISGWLNRGNGGSER